MFVALENHLPGHSKAPHAGRLEPNTSLADPAPRLDRRPYLFSEIQSHEHGTPQNSTVSGETPRAHLGCQKERSGCVQASILSAQRILPTLYMRRCRNIDLARRNLIIPAFQLRREADYCHETVVDLVDRASQGSTTTLNTTMDTNCMT